MSLKQKLLHGGIWALGGKIIAILSAFVLNLVLTRALSPADYGAYFVAFNSIIILATVATLGVDQVAVRSIATCSAIGDMRGVRHAVFRSLALVMAGIVAVCCIYIFLDEWFFTYIVKTPVLATATMLMIIWFVFATIQRQLAEIFRGFKDIRAATLYGGIRNNGIVISVSAAMAGVGIYYLYGLNFDGAVLTMIGCSALAVIVALISLSIRLKKSLEASALTTSSSVSAVTFTAILLEGLPLWCAAILGTLRLQGDSWLAAAFDTSEHVALYGAAQRFVGLVMTPLAIVNALVPPFVADLYARGDFAKLERVVRTVATIAGLPSIIVLIVFIFFGDELLAITFGDFYRSAYWALIILCFGQVMNVVTGSCFIVLTMTGHGYLVLRVSLVSTLVMLVGGYVAGSLTGIGILGVALAASIATGIHNLIGMILVRKNLGIWTGIAWKISDVVRLLSGPIRIRRTN